MQREGEVNTEIWSETQKLFTVLLQGTNLVLISS